MSELDADLYGDLYGNDETDFNDQGHEEKDATGPTEPEARPAVSTTNEQAPAKPAQTISTDTMATKFQPASTAQQAAPVAAAIASYAPPVTQQIPTYEQPQPSEYRDMAPSRGEGGYQSIPVNERAVRPSEMKDEGKMFIGGLNWDTTDESLRDYFTQFGKVDACTIMRDAAGRSRCFAFLTFEDPASVNAVMVREHFLDGKIIDPKRAIPRQEHQRATKLFIGGLAGSVTSESMREFFSQFGKVIDSTVMLDRETGRSKGFGFVSFEDTNVQPFLGFGNLEIDGKLIDVKLAQPRYQRDSYPNEDGTGQGGGGGGGGDFNQGNRFGGGGVAAAAQQTSFNAPGAPGISGAANTPFDAQALAALYTRMFQMTNAGSMNPAMMGGMNPMMGGFGGGMRPGMGMGMGMGAGMGMGGMGGAGGMGRGGMMGAGAGGPGMNQNIPRGPRGAGGGPQGPGGAMGGQNVGPQRSGQRGQHNFHPYAR